MSKFSERKPSQLSKDLVALMDASVDTLIATWCQQPASERHAAITALEAAAIARSAMQASGVFACRLAQRLLERLPDADLR